VVHHITLLSCLEKDRIRVFEDSTILAFSAHSASSGTLDVNYRTSNRKDDEGDHVENAALVLSVITSSIKTYILPFW